MKQKNEFHKHFITYYSVQFSLKWFIDISDVNYAMKALSAYIFYYLLLSETFLERKGDLDTPGVLHNPFPKCIQRKARTRSFQILGPEAHQWPQDITGAPAWTGQLLQIKLHCKIMTNSGNQPWHFWRSPNGILCLISLSGIAVNFMIFNFSFSCLISLNSAVCFALIRAAHSNWR